MARLEDLIVWRAPAPLWRPAIEDGSPHARFKGPAVLRFSSDDFMERYLDILAGSPQRLADHVALFETFEDERAGWLDAADLGDEKRVPKLYQPAHRRYYLVCASLVCERLGLPDRRIDAGAQESAHFVLRRLVPAASAETVDPRVPASYREQAWIAGDGNGGWITLDTPGRWQALEERLPLFPTRFEMEGHPRTVLAGLVPVASRESWQAGTSPAPPPADAEGESDPRKDALARLERQVLRPDAAGNNQNIVATESDAGLRREATAVVLLELQDFLASYLPDVWTAIASDAALALSAGQPWTLAGLPQVGLPPLDGQAQSGKFVALPTAQAKLLSELRRVDSDLFHGQASWARALVDAFKAREAIYGITPGPVPDYDLATTEVERIEGLIAKLGSALDETIQGGAELPPEAQTAQPKIDAGDYFLVRCVYDRPRCRGLEEPLVSEPGPVFEMAGFYDPDAPARPINIKMPDISLASLSRYRKGVTMTLNKRLRREMKRFETFDFGDPGAGGRADFGLGMICSFSIPIITIAALILLIVIVYVLNIVFWWVPFFRTCFPISKAE